MTGQMLALTPGFIVDNLRVDRVLGQGAFGITYLVTDELLGKSFALKEYVPRELVRRADDGRLLPIDDESAALFATGLDHFLQEGRTVAPLEHPNLVKVFRCFEANGSAYLLMPYYRGEALHKLLRRSGTLSADEAIALVMPLLNALEYMHRRDVIHQDIKPANIYITENGEPILLDFGAAGQRLEANSSLRWRLGSEGYAAAEQSDARGEIGPWTDIYALAATLYRSISGRVPPAASLRQQALEARQPDLLTPIEELVPGDEFAGLFEAIRRGLAVQPKERPKDVRSWRPLFTVSRPERPAAAREVPPNVEQEGREWLPIILLSLLLLAVAAATVYLFTDAGDEREADTAGDTTTPTSEQTEPPSFVSGEERARWEAALEADTPYAYQLFMQDFPKSIHRPKAQMQLDAQDEKAWQRALEEGTRSAIEAHLEAFPGGLHQADAQIALRQFDEQEAEAERQRQEAEQRDHEAWASARAARTIAAIDRYLGDWPGGLHGDEARQLRRVLNDEANEERAYAAAQKLNTIAAFQAYIDAFPNGSRVANALERIDDLTLRPGKTFRDCADCPTMVVVPAGSFWQGSEDDSPWALSKEKPRRMVTFSEPFAVGVFEITMKQWDGCVADGGCSERPPDNGWGRDNRPVIMVSWNDAQEFVNWINRKTGQSYRLPSESEWEYFARAGEEGEWIGGGPESACLYGNIAGAETGLRWEHPDCSDQAVLETLPVGSLKPNAFGIYDVIGNVAEWTLDCMNLSYLDAPADGNGWGRGICSSRMTRGGSWFTGTREIRLPARFNLKTGDRNDFTGFRLVRPVDDQ
jgi:formylglycine-generating enzyme required for sulfatase activity/serine/threonine protein kinase